MVIDSTGFSEIQDTIRDFSEPLTLVRPVEGVIVDGYVTPVTDTIVGITGHMQPLSPKEMRLVPEGQNRLEWWHIWSLSELKVDDIITDGTAIAVTVIRLESWKEGTWWHAQGVRITDYTLLPGGIGAAIITLTASATGTHP